MELFTWKSSNQRLLKNGPKVTADNSKSDIRFQISRMVREGNIQGESELIADKRNRIPSTPTTFIK